MPTAEAWRRNDPSLKSSARPAGRHGLDRPHDDAGAHRAPRLLDRDLRGRVAPRRGSGRSRPSPSHTSPDPSSADPSAGIPAQLDITIILGGRPQSGRAASSSHASASSQLLDRRLPVRPLEISLDVVDRAPQHVDEITEPFELAPSDDDVGFGEPELVSTATSFVVALAAAAPAVQRRPTRDPTSEGEWSPAPPASSGVRLFRHCDETVREEEAAGPRTLVATTTTRFASHAAPDGDGAHQRAPGRHLDVAGRGRPRAARRRRGRLARAGGEGRRHREGRGRRRPRRHLDAERHRRSRRTAAEPERLELLGSTQPFEPSWSRRWRPNSAAIVHRAAIARLVPATDAGRRRRSRPRREARTAATADPGAIDRRTAGPRDRRSGRDRRAPAAPTGETRQSRPPRTRTPRPPRATRPAPRRRAEAEAEAVARGPHASQGTAREPSARARCRSPSSFFAGGLPAVRQAIVDAERDVEGGGKAGGSRRRASSRSLSRCFRRSAPRSGVTVPMPRWPTSTRSTCATFARSSVPTTLRVTRSRGLSPLSSERRLTARVEKEHADWLAEIGTALDEGANRPRASAEHAAAEGRRSLPGRRSPAGWPRPRARRLHATATTDRWVAVLEAIAFSPVRSSVVAVSVPSTRFPTSSRQRSPGPPVRCPRSPPSSASSRPRSPVRRSRAGRCPRAVRRSRPDRERALPRLHPLRRQRREPQAEAAPEPSVEAAPVEAPDGPVGNAEPAAVEPPAPEARCRRRGTDAATHRARLRFPPISLASLRRHGHGRVRDAADASGSSPSTVLRRATQ